MSCVTRRGLFWSLTLSLLCAGATDAAGPKRTTIKRSGHRISIETTTLTAPLFLGEAGESDSTEERIPAGIAVYCSVTVTKDTHFGSSSKTCRTLTVYAYGLDAEDGTEITFEPFEDSDQLFGSGTINGGLLCVSLSTKRGDEIPEFFEGDDFEIEEAYATGIFGKPTICVTDTQ